MAAYLLHFVTDNPRILLNLNNVALACARSERDLGVLVLEDLKRSGQCLSAVAVAQKILNVVRLSFRHLYFNPLFCIYNCCYSSPSRALYSCLDSL